MDNALLSWLRRKVGSAEFDDSWCAFLTNHLFITRSLLYREAKAVARTASGRILDYGCGTLPYKHLFRHASEYIGLDYAESDYAKQHPHADMLFDGKTVPYPDHSFDWVCSFEVLTCLPDPLASLREMYRVLKPGGQLYLTSAFMWEESDPPLDFNRFTIFATRRLLAEAGFTEIHVKKIGHGWETGNQLILRYLYSVLLPTHPRLQRLAGIALTLPINIWTGMLGAIVPRTFDLYLNNIARASRPVTENQLRWSDNCVKSVS